MTTAILVEITPCRTRFVVGSGRVSWKFNSARSAWNRSSAAAAVFIGDLT